jgi:hypothetical protein
MGGYQLVFREDFLLYFVQYLSFKQYFFRETSQLHQLMDFTVVASYGGFIRCGVVIPLQDVISSLLVNGKLIYVNYSFVSSLLL